jgi:DHA1 family multidrug resistance protein-like MFS transporter
MGLLMMGQVSGLAIGPLLGGLMADAVGYRFAFVITSLLLLGAGFLVYFGVTENFVPPAEDEKSHFHFWQKWQDVFARPNVKTVYSLRFLSNLGRVLIIPFAPLFIATLLVDDGRLNTITGLAIAVTAAAGTVTAVYFGRLGDRIGHRRVLIVCALATGLLYLPQSLVSNAWQLIFLLALSGAAAGGIVPSISALLARATQTQEAGSAYGLDNSIVSASRAVAPLLGSIVIMLFSLRAAFVAAAVVYMVVALVALRFRPADSVG